MYYVQDYKLTPLYQERRNHYGIFENVAMRNKHILVFQKRDLSVVKFFRQDKFFE